MASDRQFCLQGRAILIALWRSSQVSVSAVLRIAGSLSIPKLIGQRQPWPETHFAFAVSESFAFLEQGPGRQIAGQALFLLWPGYPHVIQVVQKKALVPGVRLRDET